MSECKHGFLVGPENRCTHCEKDMEHIESELSEPKADSTELLYAARNVMTLDDMGDHYGKHVSAMTIEGLHKKSDIAAELAYRDAVIQHLTDGIRLALKAPKPKLVDEALYEALDISGI